MLHPPHDAGPLPFRDHPGEEFLVVHRGRAELLFPSGAIELGPGDSVYFKAAIPHKVRSLSEDRAAILLLISDDQSGPQTPNPRLP